MIRSVFAACNERSTEKLSIPNVQEEWLDHTWIDELTKYSSPQILSSNWIVRIDGHHLGGMRHFDRWEIADIGVLVHVRLAPGRRTSKVVLLQSTRLYPDGARIREETQSDYVTGFARLADPEDDLVPIALKTDYRFTRRSRYDAIRQGSDQVERIARYENERSLRVYYQLYNPWAVPFEQRVPLAGYAPPEGAPELGVRIIPASLLHERLAVAAGRRPSLSDFETAPPLPAHGWRLEDFVCDEVLSCHEGHRFESVTDEPIPTLFYRRSGAIAAAIAITIGSPGGGRGGAAGVGPPI